MTLRIVANDYYDNDDDGDTGDGDGEGEETSALEQLAGDIHASARSALSAATNFVRIAIGERLRVADGGVAAPQMAARPVVSSRGEGDLAAPQTVTSWGKLYGRWTNLDGDAETGKVEVSTRGLAFGFDRRIDDWRAGVVAGLGATSTDSANSSADADSYHLGLYAGKTRGALAFRSGVTYGWSSVETSRDVSFGQITGGAFSERLEGGYDAETLQAFVELGYRIETGALALEPFAGLAHVRHKTDAFTETGGDAALSVDGSTFNTTYTTLGIRAARGFDLGGVQAVANGSLGWRYAFGDTDPVSIHRFASGDSFAVQGLPLDRNAAVIEAGVDLLIAPTATLGLAYTGQHSSNANSYGLSAKLSIRF